MKVVKYFALGAVSGALSYVGCRWFGYDIPASTLAAVCSSITAVIVS